MEWSGDFLKITQKIIARKDSEPFREAVDWRELELFDYPTIIKKPMCLRLVKSNAEKHVYKTPSEAASDMRLVYSNAMTYNAPGSKMYQTAKTLSELWEQMWSATPAGAEDEFERPPSKDALIAFVEKCHFIQPEELGKVLAVLDEVCPNSIVKKPETNEIDINTDLINGRGYHEVNSYLDAMFPTDDRGKAAGGRKPAATDSKDAGKKTRQQAAAASSTTPSKTPSKTGEQPSRIRKARVQDDEGSVSAQRSKKARSSDADEEEDDDEEDD